MFVYLAAEFTSVGGAVMLLSGLQSPLAPVLGTSLITLAYSAMGGLPVSLLTDQVQGVMVLILLVVIGVGALAYTPLEPGAIAASGAADATPGGVSALVVLIIAIACANMFHGGYWQRVWAAADNKAMIYGSLGASALQILVVVLVGVLGMAAFARYGSTLFSPNYVAFLAAFFLINEMPLGWQVVAIIATVCMVASSADTLQNGMAAIFSSNPRLTVRHAQVFTVLVNVPAIILATLQLSVLSLFLLADLVAAATIVPLALGLWRRTHPNAALAGCVVGLITIIVVYCVGGALEFGSVGKGLASLYGALVLTSPTLLTAFILAPFFSGLTTVVGSLMVKYEFEGFTDVQKSVSVKV
mmetsp:Transcript_13959/g.37538  ORF Transcript_13959/g.37538 Transcript_13959/m.37538 type:complete len:357 (+) Transcript_13959:817-1887(+)